MSRQLISRSPDLRRLTEEGYEVEIRANHLVIRHVPYVAADRTVKFGSLVAALTLAPTPAGDVTTRPKNHVVMFAGEAPCDRDGHSLSKIINGSNRKDLGDGLVIDHTFSSKRPGAPYTDYHDKMTSYINMLAGPAVSIDPSTTAQTFVVVDNPDEDSPFRYADTGTSAAGIGAVSDKLRMGRVAIVGLGGTGSYILDFVAKTPVREIHLFDGDRFLPHNAFRAPGAASIDQLTGGPMKVDHFAQAYSAMHKGVVPHAYRIDASNVDELAIMSFVFLAFDSGGAKQALIEKLEASGVSFVDVGMGIQEVDGKLGGILRVTAGTPGQSALASGRISFADRAGDDDYAHNIQIAELNGLNAAFAVIRWKKHFGFYLDFEQEHFSAYTIDGNHLLNEDRP